MSNVIAVFLSSPGKKRAALLGSSQAAFGKQPIPAAPRLVRLTRAAGIPLKAVGGRSFRMSCSNAATRRAGLHGSLEWDARKLLAPHRHGGTDRKGQSETSLITMSIRFSRYIHGRGANRFSYTSTKTAHFRTHDHSAFKNFFSAVSPVRMLLRTALSFTFSRLAIFALLSPSR